MNTDIFTKFSQFINFVDLIKFAITCKSYYSYFILFYKRCTNDFHNMLYETQKVELFRIMYHFNQSTKPYVLIAGNDFGKTMIGIEFIKLNEIPGQYSLIITNPNNFTLWTNEYKKIYPQYIRRSLADRKVLEAVKHNKFIYNNTENKIILAEKKLLSSITSISSIVIDDEVNMDTYNLQNIEQLKSIKILILQNKPIQVESNNIVKVYAKHKMTYPIVPEYIIYKTCEIDILKIIGANINSNICVIVKTDSSIKSIAKRTLGINNIFSLSSPNLKNVKAYENTGGVMIANVAYASLLKHTRFDIVILACVDDFADMKNLLTLKSYFIRPSSSPTMQLYIMCKSDHMVYLTLIKNKLMLDDFNLIARKNIINIIKKLDQRINTLTQLDFVLLFCDYARNNNSYISQDISLTPKELWVLLTL